MIDPAIILILIVGLVILTPLLWLIGTYNGLVRTRQHVIESWSDVDTELKRRHNLIPNLVETVKGYAAHESEVLERVTAARAAADRPHDGPAHQARDEDELIAALDRLFIRVEAYPDLKASRNFLELQHELAETENRIQRARRFYNANVRDLNVRCQAFPSSVIAQAFGFTLAEYFEVRDAGQRLAPSVSLSGTA
ncbi:MAG: LemA family protein [Planctomycetota bacterium]